MNKTIFPFPYRELAALLWQMHQLLTACAEHASENPAEVHATGTDYIPDTPRSGKYSEVRRYIQERRRYDAEFDSYYREHSLRDLCLRLSDEFGWPVYAKSLGQNINRNRHRPQ